MIRHEEYFAGPEAFFDADGPVEVEEDRRDDALVVTAELPGVTARDAQVTVHDGMLDIRAGTLLCLVPVPPAAHAEDVQRTYSHGALVVRLRVADPERAPEEEAHA
jgi:HSP20 family molecular chaperone IbpA